MIAGPIYVCLSACHRRHYGHDRHGSGMLLQLNGVAKILPLDVFVVTRQHRPLQCCFLNLKAVQGKATAGHPAAQRNDSISYRSLEWRQHRLV